MLLTTEKKFRESFDLNDKAMKLSDMTLIISRRTMWISIIAFLIVTTVSVMNFQSSKDWQDKQTPILETIRDKILFPEDKCRQESEKFTLEEQISILQDIRKIIQSSHE